MRSLLVLLLAALLAPAWANTETLRPETPGSREEWTQCYPEVGVPPEGHWMRVCEIEPDDDASYVEDDGLVDYFSIAILENATTTLHVITDFTGDYANFDTTFTAKPSGGAWDWTSVDALEIGVTCGDETTDPTDLYALPAHAGSGTINSVRVYVRAKMVDADPVFWARATTCWAVVDYTPTPPPAGGTNVIWIQGDE